MDILEQIINQQGSKPKVTKWSKQDPYHIMATIIPDCLFEKNRVIFMIDHLMVAKSDK
jgi:hypothetical protein